ncbi:MAG: L-serine ammonia-lyase [Campylobacter sp.]|nr:L-serine ammonia-lyase [Campylobacter sp.]
MSNLNIIKIGVGPSSSHTLGVMVAGEKFCDLIESDLDKIARIRVNLHGSLSLTGKGHLTDKAIIWGLSGLKAKTINSNLQTNANNKALNGGILTLCGKKDIKFNYDEDIVFCKDFLPLHENGLEIRALDESGDTIKSEIYYSIGGGFIATKNELEDLKNSPKAKSQENLAITINNAKEAIEICEKFSWDLAKLSLEYELQFHSLGEITTYCLEIWNAMQESFAAGINPQSDNLPGTLNLHRRAKGLYNRLYASDDPLVIVDYISLYAIAIAEENASGARVVTAPTNGACAVIPAVMLYLKNHTKVFSEEKAVKFLLTAMLIGSFYKKNASISGAEAGCQAEIGSASSMAAGAMATVYGANAKVACSAASVAMEHHLGLTCDPVDGLVQIPCIERNAFGAIKAISAAKIALNRKSTPSVGLDEVIKTMYETGKDMSIKYRETSLGGLAKYIRSVC